MSERVHFTADVRILAPADQARGNHRLLFDVPNRGNRLALATFNGVPRPINPAGPTDGQWFEPGLVRLDPRSIKPSGPRRSTPRQIAWYTPCFEVPASRARRRALIRTWPEQKPVNAAGSQRNFETCA